jgi:uncharacterized SAM-binding protein YcdF (DUF218 family)
VIESLTLNHVLAALVSPTGLTIWFCCYALWKRKQWPVAVAVGILFLAACPAVANVLLWDLESPYKGPIPTGKFQAVYVLGGYLEGWQGDEKEPQWNTSGDRLELGIRMVLDGRADVLVISSGGLDGDHGARSRVIAQQRGVPAEQVVVTRPVGNTEDEAAAIKDLMSGRNWTNVALVTSAFHMRRAMFQMETAGVEVTAVATDFHAGSGSGSLLGLIPSGSALSWTELALRERLGMVFYQVSAAL